MKWIWLSWVSFDALLSGVQHGSRWGVSRHCGVWSQLCARQCPHEISDWEHSGHLLTASKQGHYFQRFFVILSLSYFGSLLLLGAGLGYTRRALPRYHKYRIIEFFLRRWQLKTKTGPNAVFSLFFCKVLTEKMARAPTQGWWYIGPRGAFWHNLGSVS